MQFYSAELIDSLSIRIGSTIKLESLRQAVVPPYLMLMPFIEVPEGIIVENQYALEEDGIHGCIYELKATSDIHDEIIIGFRDLQSNLITHQKRIELTTF